MRDALTSWGCPPSVVDDGVLLASELTSNAIEHGPEAPINASIAVTEGLLILEVTDASGERPVVQRASPEDEYGRGMRLVQEVAMAWGVQRAPHGGKTTWCLLTLPSAHETHRAHQPRTIPGDVSEPAELSELTELSGLSGLGEGAL